MENIQDYISDKIIIKKCSDYENCVLKTTLKLDIFQIISCFKLDFKHDNFPSRFNQILWFGLAI